MQPLQFAIIGCGKAAAIHAVQIKQYGVLVAVCDIDEDKGVRFAQLHGANFYQQVHELLKKEKGIDVVVICTPNGLHASQAIAAMNAGFHVLVEKPMAIDFADVNEMMAVAKTTQRHLFTVMQNRFNPPVQAVKQLLNQQQLGTIYSVQLNCFWNRNAAYYADDWHGTKAMDGGILFTQFSHFIDILIWFFGIPKKVTASLSNLAHQSTIDGEDQGVVIFEWSDGSIGTMHYSVNAFEKNREGSLTILGEKGMVKIGGAYLNKIAFAEIEGVKLPIEFAQERHLENDFENYKEQNHKEQNNKEQNRANQTNQANDYVTYQGSMRNHHHVYSSMVNTLKHGTNYYTSVSEAASTIQLIQQIMQQKQ